MVVLDDEDRENEGDLIIAAEKMTDEDVAFMVNHTSGLICVGMDGKDLDRLELLLLGLRSQSSLQSSLLLLHSYADDLECTKYLEVLAGIKVEALR